MCGLLPRRQEILNTIRVSFDFISRRFADVSKSTLHDDLGQLIKQGYIRKLGTSGGAEYTMAEGIPNS